MFTIQQATGNIKKFDTIDQLIIEYIKQYACKCNSSQNGGVSSELKDYAKVEQLDELRNDLQKMCVSTENKLIVSLDDYAKLTSLDELRTSLENYVMTTASADESLRSELTLSIEQVKEYIDKLIQTRALTTDLFDYVKTNDFVQELENATKNVVTTEYLDDSIKGLVNETTILNTLNGYTLKTEADNKYVAKDNLCVQTKAQTIEFTENPNRKYLYYTDVFYDHAIFNVTVFVGYDIDITFDFDDELQSSSYPKLRVCA